MGQKTIFRSIDVEGDPYTRIRNDVIWEETLSMKATCLLIMLLSLPEDWEISVSHLKETKTDGESAIRSALSELREAGYVHLFQNRGDSGEYSGNVYLAFNESVSRAKAAELAFSGSRDTEFRNTGSRKSNTTNKTFQQTKEGTNERESAHAPGREGPEEPPLSEEHAVSIGEEEDIPEDVARNWWLYHDARGWDRPIKNPRSSLRRWHLNEYGENGHGRFQTIEDLQGEKFTEPEVEKVLSEFKELQWSDFAFAQDDRGGQPLYSLVR